MDINVIVMVCIAAFLLGCFCVLLEIQYECKFIKYNLDYIVSSIEKIRIGGES